MTRIVLVVVGAVTVLLGLAALAGGGVAVAVHETQRDDDGYYSSAANPFATPTHALVSNGLDVGAGDAAGLVGDDRLGTIRVAATGSEKPIFVGVGRESDVAAYLRGVEHDRVTDFELDPFAYESERRPGTTTPTAPADGGIWAATASGNGAQTLTWPVEEGDWSVVVMNADGSRGVEADVSVGAKVGVVLWVGVGLLVVGAIVAIGGAALLIFGFRTPPRTPSPAAPAVPAGAGGHR
jgi:hypothetical protein